MKTLSMVLGVLTLMASNTLSAEVLVIDCNRYASPARQATVFGNKLARLRRGGELRISGHCQVNLTIAAKKTDITLNGQNSGILDGPDPSQDTLRIEGTGIVVKNLEITGGRDGVHIHWGGQAQQRGTYGLEGNNIHHTGRHGIAIHGNAGSRFGNNTIADNPGWGVTVFENSQARIGIANLGDVGDGNTIVRNGAGGIQVERSSTAHIVSNTLTDNGGPGVEIRRGSYVQVLNNAIQRNGHRGVSFGGGASGRVAYNDISQNDLSGIRLNKNSNASLGGNSSSVANVGAAVECYLASLVDGALDGLAGSAMLFDTDGTCTEALADYP